MKRVYYADKVIFFSPDFQTSEGKVLFDPAGEVPTIERVLKALDDTHRLTVWSPDAEALFEGFCARFTPVEAAGGVVFCGDGASDGSRTSGERVLMIRRRGFWDLPKGHREEGESLPECAAREVSEESGLAEASLEVGAEIADTLHFYWYERAARWEMKRTTWYAMRYGGDPADVAPQAEEDITAVEWMTPAEAVRAAAGSYMTIQEVVGKI